eukprot:TRINITY_DN1708_c0_g1_i1.p1 TRINITY_DN1708_c0_g1~~TRINITY_DN1708_c0_g1_i1.p1  ORF type:complete len:364 (+),score=45.97 TRINITY_DN1708_c0_g1_i1:291-1382(+)
MATQIPEVVVEESSSLSAAPAARLLAEAVVVVRPTQPEGGGLCSDIAPSLKLMSLLCHLAIFGFLGVLIRFGLEIFFGPEHLHVTDNQSSLFIDMPANMVGSFIMGWVGVVFKPLLSSVSTDLAVGLSTGLCGSITTFASWNQQMLSLGAEGDWVFALTTYLLGIQVSYASLVIGIDSAEWLLHALEARKSSHPTNATKDLMTAQNEFDRKWISLICSLVLAVGMWIASGIATATDDGSDKRKKLWIACNLAPVGVWVRWYLSRFNGRKLWEPLDWLPWGTLATNVGAASLESVVSLLQLRFSGPLGVHEHSVHAGGGDENSLPQGRADEVEGVCLLCHLHQRLLPHWSIPLPHPCLELPLCG